jgi:hypothetical protein
MYYVQEMRPAKRKIRCETKRLLRPWLSSMLRNKRLSLQADADESATSSVLDAAPAAVL